MKVTKKIFLISLIYLLIFSLVPCVLADNDDGVFSVLSEYYMVGGEGVGFHDTENTDDLMEKSVEYWGHGGIILRPGEWTKYEFSEDMRSGTYSVYLSMANYYDNKVNISVNDSVTHHYINVPKTEGPNGEFDGSMQYYKKRFIGDVYIKEGTNVLTVSACKDAFTLKDITLVYKNNNESYQIAHSGLYSCINNGLSGSENSSSPEVGYISGDGSNYLPNKMLVMRTKSSFTFDISHFSQGTYKVSMKHATNSDQKLNLILSSDEKGTENSATMALTIPKTGSWNTYSETVVAEEMFIHSDADFLTLEVVANANQLDYLIFEKISDRAERFEKAYYETTNMIPNQGFYAGKQDGVVRTTFETPINGLSSDKSSAGMRQGYFMEYDFSCLLDGEYTISIIGGSYQDEAAVDVYVNGVLKIKDGVLGKTGAYSELTNYKEMQIGGVLNLNEENKIIKIYVSKSKAFNLKSIVLKAKDLSPSKVLVLDENNNETFEVNEGKMSASAVLGDYFDGYETMFIFVIYKTDSLGRKVIYKTALAKSDKDTEFLNVIEDINKEEGFDYSYKVFLLKSKDYAF